jgi:hypothetical protein
MGRIWLYLYIDLVLHEHEIALYKRMAFRNPYCKYLVMIYYLFKALSSHVLVCIHTTATALALHRLPRLAGIASNSCATPNYFVIRRRKNKSSKSISLASSYIQGK